MARKDTVAICTLLMTCVCLGVVFFWTVWQQVLIDELRDGTTEATTTTTIATTSTSVAPPSTTATNAVASAKGLGGEFVRRMAEVRQNMIDPLLVREEELRKRNELAAAPRSHVKIVRAKPAVVVPPKPIFQKQVRPEKVDPVPALLDEIASQTDSDDDEKQPAVRTEEDRSARSSLAMAANELKHKAAALRAASTEENSAPKQPQLPKQPQQPKPKQAQQPQPKQAQQPQPKQASLQDRMRAHAAANAKTL
jgi:hypothetical protein